ncbi:MAG: ribonuclease R [Pseudomonadota bacterium]
MRLLGNQSEPVSWRELVRLLDVDDPRRITQLRQLLRGLERNQELVRDHSGAYSLPKVLQAQEYLVEKLGRGLGVGGQPIEALRKSNLRAGDVVLVHWVGDEPRILEVISHSDQLLIGELKLDGRDPYVQGLGEFKGRVFLETQPPRDLRQDTAVHVRVTGQIGRRLVGELVGEVAHENVLDLAINTALMNHEIPHEWPQAVLTAADKLPKSVQPSRFKGRVDLQALPLVTIDGETAKDFDDAVYAQTLPGRKGWRLVVAIADVAHYVKNGSALDIEAQNRGTSVYFPERVVPMLPEAISNELCSLKPKVPRLSLVCDMSVNGAGQVTSHTFYEAVIYSHARLTYGQVQGAMDGDSDLDVSAAVSESLVALYAVYAKLRQAREKRGALDFATREGGMRLQDGRIAAVFEVKRLAAHQVIEEAMIAANVCAALFLEANHQGGLYRVHEPPEATKTEELRQALAVAGVRLPGGVLDPAAMQRALSRLPPGADAWLYAQLALRSLQQAVYTPENKGHFGLALERYMHFTSPIRRYPDLLVHRAIKAVLAKQAGSGKRLRPASGDELVSFGEMCSQYERRAESAGWFVDGWLKCDYLMQEVGNTLDGIVAGVTEFGLFIELDGYYVQGLLHIANLGSDYFHFKAQSFSLVGEKSGRQFRLGDRLKVVVAEIQPSQGKIDLLLEGGPKQRSKSKGDRLKGGRKRGGRRDRR